MVQARLEAVRNTHSVCGIDILCNTCYYESMKTYVATVSIPGTNTYLYHFTVDAENEAEARSISAARVCDDEEVREILQDVRLTGTEGDD